MLYFLKLKPVDLKNKQYLWFLSCMVDKNKTWLRWDDFGSECWIKNTRFSTEKTKSTLGKVICCLSFFWESSLKNEFYVFCLFKKNFSSLVCIDQLSKSLTWINECENQKLMPLS